MISVYQWIDERSFTRTYVLVDADTRDAVVIDAVRDCHPTTVAALDTLDVNVVALIETHVHADHITGALLLADALARPPTENRAAAPSPQIIVSKHAGVTNGLNGAVRFVDDGDTVVFGDTVGLGRTTLNILATPGHTEGCISVVLAAPFVDHAGGRQTGAVFCGDALLIGGCGRTDFQGGDAATLYNSVRNKLFSLEDTTVVYPAHDYKGRSHSFIGHEREHNARLKDGMSAEMFLSIMDNLHLRNPAQIDVAVPANQAVGAVGPEWDAAQFAARDDGVLEALEGFISFETGLPPPGIVLLDTRPDDERRRDGQLSTAIPVDFSTLPTVAQTWSRAMPAVTICRRGIRSVDAAKILMDLGFTHVASLKGGMELFAASTPADKRAQLLGQGVGGGAE